MFKPSYEITDMMLNKISEIEALRSRISNSVLLPEREIEMRHRMAVNATHSSTSIEGNSLTIKRVAKVLAVNQQDTPITRHGYEEAEVKNYKKALDFVSKRKTKKKPIGLTDILSVHKILMEGLSPKEKIGCLRTNDIYIVDQDGQEKHVDQYDKKSNLIYSGPESRLLVRELGELLFWLEHDAKDIHPIIAASVFHYLFVSIHPFANGNGCCARILTILYLGLRKYDFRGSLVLDSYYASDKLEYFGALRLADNYDDRKSAALTPWLTYYTCGFLSSAKGLMREVLLLSVAIKDPKEIKRIGRDEADLLRYAKHFGSMSLSEAMDILPDVPRRTMQRRLKALVDDGYLRLTGSTTSARYDFVEKK